MTKELWSCVQRLFLSGVCQHHFQPGMDHPAGAVTQIAAGGQGQNPVGVFRADAVKCAGILPRACLLTEGSHNLTFTYENRAFALGWKVSLLCALILLAVVHLVYKPDWKRYLPGK